MVFGGGSLYLVTNNVIGNIFLNSRSQLQKNFSAQLGHDVIIGPYKGLRAWGFSIGSSKILEGPLDTSSASFSNLKIQFAPIASVLNWRPVLVVSPKDTKIFLNSNKDGSYWVLGSSEGGSPPNLNLRLRLDSSSEIYIDSKSSSIKPKANVLFRLPEKKIVGKLSFLFNDEGSLSLKGSGYFNQVKFNGKAIARNLDLENFQSTLFKNRNFFAGGNVNGNIKLGVNSSNLSCRGEVSFKNLTLLSKTSTSKLISPKTSIICRNGKLELLDSDFQYETWNGRISGAIPFKNTTKYDLKIKSFLRSNDQLNAPLNLKASLPFWIDEGRFLIGELSSEIDLKTFKLSSLSPLIGVPVSGKISTSGTINGPLPYLKTDLSIKLEDPQLSALKLQEKWEGEFNGLGGSGQLSIASVSPDTAGKLDATFTNNFSLKDLALERYGGSILVNQTAEGYSWKADNFRLDRLEIAVPPENSFKRVMGKMIGQGSFKMNPFFIDGKLTTKSYRWLGVALKKWQLSGSYSENKYSMTAEIIPPAKGKILINADGRIGGEIKARTEVKGIRPSWLLDTGLKISEFDLFPKIAFGTANDLSKVSINPDESLDNQISLLQKSLIALNDIYLNETSKKLIDPKKLRGSINAIANLEGSQLSDLKLDVEASGKLWIRGSRRKGVAIKPFKAQFFSQSLNKNGEFVLLNLPFSMLSLFFSTPSSISGMFGITGRYRFNKKSPELTAELVLEDAKILDKEFVLEKSDIFIANSVLKTDISFREITSTETVSIFGDIPLSSEQPFDLQIESHGNALSFLDGLSNDVVSWESGSIDMKLLIRGASEEVTSNGFLVIKNGRLLLNEMPVRDFNSKIFFDFNRFDVQSLEAKLGRKGKIKASGALALFRPSKEAKEQLNVQMKSIKLKQQNYDVNISSDLQIGRSVLNPLIGGQISISEGTISTKRSRPRRKDSIDSGRNTLKSIRLNSQVFPEQSWDYQDVAAKPLILFLQDKESPASKILSSGIPKGYSYIGFNSLNVVLGPNLNIVSQPIASFTTSGKIILDGTFDENLDLTGLIRLEKGRVNLFTTTFNLDRKYKNTATFTPSMGLVPFLDIKLITRVPDVANDTDQSTSSNDFVLNSSTSVGIGGSRLVKIDLIATGLADRVAETYELSSTPVLPQSYLFNLIGGNSLTMLMTGSQREVLVGLLGRSLVSPALGRLSDAFSERIQLAFYPAFVSNKFTSDETDNSDVEEGADFVDLEDSQDDLSPKQSWIAEVGMDLSDKINLSIQTTPNRNDIPPHGTLTYQFLPSVGVLGSLDNDGNWQSQLQLFLKY